MRSLPSKKLSAGITPVMIFKAHIELDVLIPKWV